MAVSSHMTIRDMRNVRSSYVRVYNKVRGHWPARLVILAMMEKLKDAVKTASAELGYLLLKEKQLEVITSFLSGRDVCG